MVSNTTKRANWLELFFDLIFVYAVAKATHILAHAHNGHIAFEQYVTFILVMTPIWWAWTGHTLFATRFDTEDTGQRILTLAQMLAVVFWTTFINADFDPNYRGYLLFYVLIRVLLILMYWRSTKYIPLSVPISKRLSIGFSIGIMVALSSLFFESPIRYIILYAGIGIEILTPLLSRKILATVPVKSHHLPERYGLLTIILLGESVIMIATKLNEVQWSVYTVGTAIVGFIILSAIWWMNFSLMDRHVIGKELRTGQNVIYGHLFVYSGMSIIAVFIGFSIVPELTFVSHLLLFVSGLVAMYVGYIIIYGISALVKKNQLLQLVLIMFSAFISLFLKEII